MTSPTLKITGPGGTHELAIDNPLRALPLPRVGADTRVDVSQGDGYIEITLASDSAWEQDISVVATLPMATGSEIAHANWPSYRGNLDRHRVDSAQTYEFRGPGWNSANDDAHRFGIPALLLESDEGIVLVGADPSYSVEIGHDDGAAEVELAWTYRAAAGIHERATRRLVWAPASSVPEALDMWFSLATPDVPAGPQWLHDIAWQHYDFMSKDGRGWFADIDAMCDLVEPEHRGRVAFTLHGWYDTVGRYCLDRDTGQLDEHWTVFPFINDPRLDLGDYVPEIGNQPRGYKFRNMDDYRPLPMDWDEVRQRIEYAKSRGFRVPFYLITGLMDLGNAAEHAAAGDGLLTEGSALWAGPDAIGDTYIANPLHPEVRDRYLTLTREVLKQVGDLVDALVVDEAFYIGYGQLGPVAQPGYADLAQATLLREMAQLCHEHRPDLALLTADHVGTQGLEHQAFPYSLFADGMYHDAWNHPQTQLATTFPAWRNVAWSCLWAPSTALANTKWAVLAHDATIATSNGCFGDDLGIAEMPERDVAELSRLWEFKRTTRQRARLRLVDMSPYN